MYALARPRAENAAPRAPSRNTQPTASATRPAVETRARARAKGDHRRDPSDQRRAGEQAQATELAFGSLPPQLEARRFVRAPALFLELASLELQPRVIAVERFLQCRHDDVGEGGFELRAERRGWRRRPAWRCSLTPEARL